LYDLPFGILSGELDDLHHPKSSPFEGPKRSEIAFLRICKDGANRGVYKDTGL